MKITKKDYDDCADLEEIRWTFIDKHAQEESFIHRDKTSITACIQAEYGSGICIPGSQIEVSYSRNFSDREKIKVSYEIFGGDGEKSCGGIGFDHELKGITFSQLQAADDNTIMNLSKTLFGDFKWEINRFLDGDKQQLIIEKMDINDLDFDGEFPPVSKNFEVKNGVLVKYKGNEEEVQIPSYITSIGDYAFNGCQSLKKITVPESIKKIGDGVFLDCRNLEEAHLPQCDKGKAIFEGCINLNRFSYYGKVTERMFYGSGIKRANINSEKCEVEDLAYANCKNLEEFRIRESTDINIAKTAFEGCPNVTFKCYKDSPAEEYFKKNNYRYEYLEAEKEQSKTKEDKVMDEKKRTTNPEKLMKIVREKPPLIFFDVETTGIMNGNDNHITQLAMTAYNYNHESKRYELQDNIFMLAKAHPDTLHNIEVKGAATEENVSRILKNEYVDAYRQEISRGYTNIQNRMKTLEKRISKKEEQIGNCTERQVKRKESLEADLTRYKTDLQKEKAAFEAFKKIRELVFDKEDKPIDFGEKPEQEIDKLIESIRTDAFIAERGNVFPTSEVVAGIYTFKRDKAEFEHAVIYKNVTDYVSARLENKIKTLEDESLDKVLSVQGIDKGKWIKEGLGLTTGEIQTGINEFLKKYDSDPKHPAAYVTNGTYYAKHYLTKDNLSIVDTTKRDVFDLYQHEKWAAGSENKWTANVGVFAKMYKDRTGKEIKTFDAFTKALCYAEMLSGITSVYRADMEFINRSVNQLANAVAEKVASMDEDYVMSAARASALNWRISTQYEFEHSTYKFNNLDYVDFGTERKYVDINKLFEVNGNFEVTLEGEKEPIKSWEELETKIKALNANISDSLLDQIKVKYEEIEQKAQEDKKKTEEQEKEPELTDSPVSNKGQPSKSEESKPESESGSASSDIQARLSNILADFENRYDKISSELEQAKKEFDEIQKDDAIFEKIGGDLKVLGNFIQTVCTKIGNFNDSDKKVHCHADKDRVEICLYEKHLKSYSGYKGFAFPKINISCKYYKDQLSDVYISYSEGGIENPYHNSSSPLRVHLDITRHEITKYDYGEEYPSKDGALFSEVLTRWDGFKELIIDSCQASLDKKICRIQKDVEGIKENIAKYKEQMERT